VTRSKGASWASDEEFVRAADEVMRHIEIEHDLRLSTVISTSERRTVLTIRITAHFRDGAAPEAAVGAVQGHFPNSRAGTLAAYLFSLLTMLDHTLDANSSRIDERVRQG